MTVRVIRVVHPRPTDQTTDQPYEAALTFNRAYQLDGRLIAVDPTEEIPANVVRQYTRRHLKEVDFDRVSVIPYDQMVKELPSDNVPNGVAEPIVERLQ